MKRAANRAQPKKIEVPDDDATKGILVAGLKSRPRSSEGVRFVGPADDVEDGATPAPKVGKVDSTKASIVERQFDGLDKDRREDLRGAWLKVLRFLGKNENSPAFLVKAFMDAQAAERAMGESIGPLPSSGVPLKRLLKAFHSLDIGLTIAEALVWLEVQDTNRSGTLELIELTTAIANAAEIKSVIMVPTQIGGEGGALTPHLASPDGALMPALSYPSALLRHLARNVDDDIKEVPRDSPQPSAERRYALDGGFYTKEQFVALYGGIEWWEQAGKAVISTTNRNWFSWKSQASPRTISQALVQAKVKSIAEYQAKVDVEVAKRQAIIKSSKRAEAELEADSFRAEIGASDAALKDVQCPGKHGMKVFEVTISIHSCSRCGSSIGVETWAMGCRTCNFNLCRACLNILCTPHISASRVVHDSKKLSEQWHLNQDETIDVPSSPSSLGESDNESERSFGRKRPVVSLPRQTREISRASLAATGSNSAPSSRNERTLLRSILAPAHLEALHEGDERDRTASRGGSRDRSSLERHIARDRTNRRTPTSSQAGSRGASVDRNPNDWQMSSAHSNQVPYYQQSVPAHEYGTSFLRWNGDSTSARNGPPWQQQQQEEETQWQHTINENLEVKEQEEPESSPPNVSNLEVSSVYQLERLRAQLENLQTDLLIDTPSGEDSHEKKVSEPSQQTQHVQKLTLQQLFSRLTYNTDSYACLTRDEVIDAAAELEMTPGEAAALFDELDVDRSGTLSRDEVRAENKVSMLRLVRKTAASRTGIRGLISKKRLPPKLPNQTDRSRVMAIGAIFDRLAGGSVRKTNLLREGVDKTELTGVGPKEPTFSLKSEGGQQAEDQRQFDFARESDLKELHTKELEGAEQAELHRLHDELVRLHHQLRSHESSEEPFDVRPDENDPVLEPRKLSVEGPVPAGSFASSAQDQPKWSQRLGGAFRQKEKASSTSTRPDASGSSSTLVDSRKFDQPSNSWTAAEARVASSRASAFQHEEDEAQQRRWHSLDTRGETTLPASDLRGQSLPMGSISTRSSSHLPYLVSSPEMSPSSLGYKSFGHAVGDGVQLHSGQTSNTKEFHQWAVERQLLRDCLHQARVAAHEARRVALEAQQAALEASDRQRAESNRFASIVSFYCVVM